MQFYKEENFKEIDGLRVPEDWEVRELKDVCKKIKAGGTPKTSIKEYYENGTIPFVKIEDITDSNKYLSNTKIKITKEGLNNSNAWIVPKNSVLFAMYGSIGETAINKIEVTTNQAILGIIPKDNILKSEFLYYILAKNKNYYSTLGMQTTQKNLNAQIVKSFKIPLPPIEEQKQIAKILNDFDSLIETINKQIETLNKAKKGMMKKLFTKGVFEHKGFKKSEIGEIPEDWVLFPAEKVCTKVTDGTHDTPKPTKRGYYLITSKHLKDNEINFSEAYFISEENFKKINKRSKVDRGDVLFSMIGTVGITAIVKPDYPDFAIKNVGLFKTGGNFDLAYWLYYYFQSHLAKRYIKDNLKGSTQKYMTLNALRKFPIPLPPLEEQKAISEKLKAIDDLIEIKRKEKEQVEKAKKKVMELLLTGKVRVKNLNS